MNRDTISILATTSLASIVTIGKLDPFPLLLSINTLIANQFFRLLSNNFHPLILGSFAAGLFSTLLQYKLPALLPSSLLNSSTSTATWFSTFNRILFLRFVSGLRNYILNVMKKPKLVDLIIHFAVAITFFGVLNRPDITPRLIVNMCRRFVGKGFLNSWKENENDKSSVVIVHSKSNGSTKEDLSAISDSRKEEVSQTPKRASSPSDYAFDGKQQKDTIDTPLTVFVRSFNGLFMYNTIMHLAALGISSAIRKKSPPNLDAIKFALKEAMILNVAVASSCTILVSTGFVVDKVLKLPKIIGSAIAALSVPLPLQAIHNDSVKQSIFFLFVPWSIRFLSSYVDEIISNRKHESEDGKVERASNSSEDKSIPQQQQINLAQLSENARLSLLYSLGLGLSLATNKYSSNSWAVTILFSVAQRTISQAVRSFE